MTTFLNKNKALALSATSVVTLMFFSTIAACSFCACAHTKDSTTPVQAPQKLITQEFSHTFEIDNPDSAKRMYTMDVVLYNDDGDVEKMYTPIINNNGDTCSGN